MSNGRQIVENVDSKANMDDLARPDHPVRPGFTCVFAEFNSKIASGGFPWQQETGSL